MSWRRIAAVALSTVALVSGGGSVAEAVPDENQDVIFWMDGLTARDFLRCQDAPAFCHVGRAGGLALLSTRTDYTGEDPALVSASAGATIAAGERREAEVASTLAPPRGSPFAGMPLIRVRRAGVSSAAGPVLVTRRSDGTDVPVREVPEGKPGRVAAAVAQALARGGDVMVDLASQNMKSAKVSLSDRYPVVDDTFKDAAATVAAVMQMDDVGPRTIWIVSAVPPRDRIDAGIRLGVIARCCSAPMLLRSATTKRAGVVSLIDLAPTLGGIVSYGSGSAPLGDGGTTVVESAGPHPRGIRGVPVRYPADRLDKLESEIVHAALARFPLTRRASWLAIAAVAFAAWLVARGVGRADRASVPRGWRAWSTVLLLTAAAMPVWIYVEGVLPVSSVLAATLVVAGLSLATAVVGRARFGPIPTLVLICAAGAAIPVIDLFFGTPIAYRSPLAFQIAGGGRFYGVDEGVLGLVLGAHLVAAGFAVDRAKNTRRAVVFALVSFAVVAWALGAPGLGAKFGAPLTAVPAFGVMALLLAGRRITTPAILGIVIATIGVTGAMVLVDKMLAPESATHVARAASGETDLGDLVVRKLEAQVRITTNTIWTAAALTFAGALALIRLKRRDAWDRGLWGRPALRAAIAACAVGAITGLVFNDGGVLASAPILLYAAAGALLPLVEPSR